MKKILVFLLTSVSLFLCAKDVSVLCTTIPAAALTRAVLDGVPGYKVTVMLPAGTGCPHDYSLTPSDMRKLVRADVIVMNGLGMESFLTPTLAKLSKKTILMDASKDVKGLLPNTVLEEHEEAEEHEHEHEAEEHEEHHHHDHGAMNEHYFAGAATAIESIESLRKQFAAAFPKDKDLFKGNPEVLKILKEVLQEEQNLAKTVAADKKNVVIQHGIFDYFVRDCGLVSAGSILKDEVQEPSASEAAALLKKMQAEKTAFIFAEKGKISPMTKMISRESGIPVLELTMNPENSDPVKYARNFQENLTTFRKALQVK